MLGQLLSLPLKDLPGQIIGNDNKIYYFTDNDCDKSIYLEIGIGIEFTPYKQIPDSPYKKTKLVKITKSFDDEPLEDEIDKIYFSNTENPKNKTVIETIKSYYAYGEGGSKKEALTELAQLANICHANTILKLRLEINIGPSKQTRIFKYYGLLARTKVASEEIINNSEKEPQIKIIPKMVRRTSPNVATKLKIQGGLLLFLLFFIPLWGQIFLKYHYFIPQGASAPIGIFICILIFILYININPFNPCYYLKVNKQ